tara:strand:+ start:3685 stop:4230 length:546 start_codon:yes stop_codon:yes gene_type:complete
MYFQNLEFYETDNFQYLLIHKNACTSVLKTIEHLKPKYSEQRNFNKVCWTVIRDPYERFMAGLSYDIERQKMKIEDVSLDNLFSTYHEKTSREKGNVSHTAYQSIYLINSCINWYVDLPDLKNFLNMHFNKSFYLNRGPDIKQYFKKEEVLKYLKMEYEIYNKIKLSSFIWEWQKGNIFNT